ncbi:MAG TPA: hypothetical protein VJV78_28660 [Polyangiales bacterium]|nr:hypothetical protein [Polyangiales bacterium]
MSLPRTTLLYLALGLAAGACFEGPKKSEPTPPPAASDQTEKPPPSAADLNALAGPVLPKHRSAAPGTAAVLPRLAPNANTPETRTDNARTPTPPELKAPPPSPSTPKPTAAELDPRALIGPVLPKGKPAPKPAQPQAPTVPETERVNLDALAAPVLPNSPAAKQPKPVLPKLDQVERDALSMPDLPPPSMNEDAKVPGAKLAPQPSAAAAANPAAQQQQPQGTPAAYLITAKGVGALRVGSRFSGSPGFENRYTTTFYGDAQPLEGFTLDEPPLFVAVNNGPFVSWGRSHPGQTPPYPIRQRAMALARSGKLRVGMLVVTDPTPKTERGVGVGDDYVVFARAYPKAGQPTTYPGLWEEPSCVITQKSLWFFFDRCDSPAHAKLIRIAIRAR